jgi:hypothetical protein
MIRKDIGYSKIVNHSIRLFEGNFQKIGSGRTWMFFSQKVKMIKK